MRYEAFSDLCVAEIMNRWPATIAVFIDFNMHCIGCPIGAFHTLVDAAVEPAVPVEQLAAEIATAIDGGGVREGRERARRRSATIGADLSPGASGGRLRPNPPPPRR